jgi:hypothetical protein
MNAPGPPKAMPKPEFGDGGVLVGSGKVANPCWRMHRASLTSSSLCLSEDAALGPPPGSSFWHAFCAAWNAGEKGLMPEPWLIWILPFALGSGKFGTPCARMQFANLIPAAWLLELGALLELCEAPHAVSATTEPVAASATKTRRQSRIRVAGVLGTA